MSSCQSKTVSVNLIQYIKCKHILNISNRKTTKEDDNIIIKLYSSGQLKPQLILLKYYFAYSYFEQSIEQQYICYFDLLNYTYDKQSNYIPTSSSNGKQIIILQNNINSTLIYQQSELLIYDLKLCEKTQIVYPYYQLKLQLNITNFSAIGYLTTNILSYETQGELFILKSTGLVTGVYKETEEDSIISIIAQNPINLASQSLSINDSPKKETSKGLTWYWLVLIIISSFVIAWMCVYQKEVYYQKYSKGSRKLLL